MNTIKVYVLSFSSAGCKSENSRKEFFKQESKNHQEYRAQKRRCKKLD